MSVKINVIAIDGPAGSGKSTVARTLAARLNYFYVDTGAMYRALTLKALQMGIDLKDSRALTELSGNTDIRLEDGAGGLKVMLDDDDVTGSIRDLSVSDKVKFIARVEGVRANMVKKQRDLAVKHNGAVLEGRDIGTVVFPDALHKFYLDASFDERVKRRFRELIEKGLNVSEDQVRRDLSARDTTDMTRDFGPLKKAKDAVKIDTTMLTVDEVIKKVSGKIDDVHPV